MTDNTKLTIYYDADCGFCSFMALIWANRLGNNAVAIPGQTHPEYKALMETHNSWLVIDNASGKFLYRFDGILAAMQHIKNMTWLVPILGFFPFRFAGNIGYRLISKNRRLISVIFFRNAVCKVS